MGYTIEQFVVEVNSFLICKVCEKVFMKHDELLRKNHNLKREFEEIKSALEQQLNQIYKEKEMQQQQIGYNYKTNPPQYSSRYTGPPMMPSFNGEDEATTYGSNLSMIKPIKKRRMTDSINSSCESPLQVVCCPDVPLPIPSRPVLHWNLITIPFKYGDHIGDAFSMNNAISPNYRTQFLENVQNV